jgi:hypothetical protein
MLHELDNRLNYTEDRLSPEEVKWLAEEAKSTINSWAVSCSEKDHEYPL